MHKLLAGAALGLALLATTTAEAQRQRPAQTGQTAQSQGYQARTAAPSPQTGPYSHPPGYDGTIRWNTPDANGNFSTSMGAGGGGP